jgi:hypothetical protein
MGVGCLVYKHRTQQKRQKTELNKVSPKKRPCKVSACLLRKYGERKDIEYKFINFESYNQLLSQDLIVIAYIIPTYFFL